MALVLDDSERAHALIGLHERLADLEREPASLRQQAAAHAAALLAGTAALWLVEGNRLVLRSFGHHHPAGSASLETLLRGLGEGEGSPVAAAVASGLPVRPNAAEIAVPGLGQDDLTARRQGVVDLVVVPLSARGSVLGALALTRERGAPRFTDEDLTFMGQVVRVVSLSVANAQLLVEVERTQRQADLLLREDELTGLLNRRGFLEVLGEHLAGAATQGLLVAVLDMDGFKLVNDGFGHAAGDMVLASLAARLCSALPDATPVARLGGDEFAVLVEADDDETAAAVIEHAVRTCTGVINVVGLSVPISLSVGTAVPMAGGADQVLLHADLAMYRAKRRGGLTAAYDPRLDDPATRRLREVLDLRRSIAGSELVVHYQPVVPVGTGPIRVEALVRRNVGGRLLAPGSWLPMASRAGLMPELTANVVGQVVEQLSRWWSAGLEVECAVNVPAPVLAAPDCVASLLRRLDAAGLPRRALSVEVTEGDLVGPQARSALLRCADADIGVAVDDFGTGWSALSYLVDLPLRTLKLDRTLVGGIDVDARRASVVNAIVQVAHELGLRVVAEGVETRAVADVVIDLGADAIQGYVYARPASASDIEPLLRAGLEAVRS